VSDSRICNIVHCLWSWKYSHALCLSHVSWEWQHLHTDLASRVIHRAATWRSVCPHLTGWQPFYYCNSRWKFNWKYLNKLPYLCDIKPCSPLKVKPKTFRRNISPPSSVSKKPSKIPAWKQVTSWMIYDNDSCENLRILLLYIYLRPSFHTLWIGIFSLLYL
jgi:hypothetical protein